MAIIGALDLLFRGDTSELDKAYGKVVSGARRTKQQVDSIDLFGKLKKDGSGALLDIAKGLAAPVAGFMALHTIISNITAQMDKMAALSKQAGHLGMGVGNLQSLQGAFSKAGLSPDAVGGTLSKLQEHTAEAVQNPSSEGASAYRELGLNASKLSGMGGEDQFKTVLDALAKVQNVGERTRLAMQLFGREAGAEIATGFSHGSKAIDEAREKLQRFGVLLDDQGASSVAAAKRAVDDYGLAWQGLWQQLTVHYSPDIQAFFSMLTEGSLDAQKSLKGTADEFDPMTAIFGGIMDVGQDVWIVFRDIADTLGAIIADAAQLVGWMYKLGAIGATLGFSKGNNAVLDFGNELEKNIRAHDAETQTMKDHPWSEEFTKKRKQAMDNAGKTGHPSATGSPIQPQKDWTQSITDTLAKLREENATIGMNAQQKELYKLATEGATDAQKAEARTLAESIQAKQTAQRMREADPIWKATQAIKEYDQALSKGTITEEQYAEAVRHVGNELSGESDKFADYAAKMRALSASRGMMSDTQYDQAAAKAKTDLTGIKNPLAEFDDRMRDLDRMVSRKVHLIDFAQFHDEAQKAKHDLLGIAETPDDKLRDYNKELQRLADLWKKGKITADEYKQSANSALGKLGIGLSPAQQVEQAMGQKRSLDQWAGQNNVSHDSVQYKDALKGILPDYLKQLKDSTATPYEKLNEGIERLNEWKNAPGSGMSDKMYSRGLMQLREQAGLGEHKFAGAEAFGTNEAQMTILRNQNGNDAQNPQIQLVDISRQQLTYLKAMAGDAGSTQTAKFPY
jgi:hypothetical protein